MEMERGHFKFLIGNIMFGTPHETIGHMELIIEIFLRHIPNFAVIQFVPPGQFISP